MSSDRRVETEYPVHELIALRWSPYAYDAEREVSEADLRSLFEAARWSFSSYNEQPWRYIVATHAEPAEFAQLLSCLVEVNQQWAGAAPVPSCQVKQKAFPVCGVLSRCAAVPLCRRWQPAQPSVVTR